MLLYRKELIMETHLTKTLILPTSSPVLGLPESITTADISSFTQTQVAPSSTVESSAADLSIRNWLYWATIIWFF